MWEHARADWRAFCRALGETETHADRIWTHLFRRLEWNAEVPGISRSLKAALAAMDWSLPEVVRRVRAADGSEKLLIRYRDGASVETVWLPIGNRIAQCVSTQAGCAMGCRFCHTATMGLHRNLSAGEMLAQILLAIRVWGAKPRNLVLMGMGEPLHNLDAVLKFLAIVTDPKGLAFAPRRITLSTVGLVPGILRLAELRAPCHLAVSLHAPNDAIRARLV
ncbi:MAG: radical SAM protein, partial [Zetaproteobacteria bacterium]